MNFKFKFNLGDKVVVPHLGLISNVIGEVESFRVYRDKSILVLVRWGGEEIIHSDFFTEKELKMTAHPKPKPRPKPKPKPKPRRAKVAAGRALIL